MCVSGFLKWHTSSSHSLCRSDLVSALKKSKQIIIWPQNGWFDAHLVTAQNRKLRAQLSLGAKVTLSWGCSLFSKVIIFFLILGAFKKYDSLLATRIKFMRKKSMACLFWNSTPMYIYSFEYKKVSEIMQTYTSVIYLPTYIIFFWQKHPH